MSRKPEFKYGTDINIQGVPKKTGDIYRVSTKKVHLSPPGRKAKLNFFCGHPVCLAIKKVTPIKRFHCDTLHLVQALIKLIILKHVQI